MKILIAGSNGMIGSAVTRHLTHCGYDVTRLVRHNPGPKEVFWNPDAGEIDTAGLEGFDGVIHLATMPWPMRWTGKTKQKMNANRQATNRLLAESLAGCEQKPKVLICASGMGYYASSGDTVLTENSLAGKSFLSRLQLEGEAASAPASQSGIRVVNLRIPLVLGGPTLLRAGFQAGGGQQWVSWVGLDELASIIEYALVTDSLAGPVNAVSPNPMRNADFAIGVSHALQQKCGNKMPAFIVLLVMGEMGEELLLASRRIQPAKLLASGYQFRFPELAAAVRHEKESMNTIIATKSIK